MSRVCFKFSRVFFCKGISNFSENLMIVVMGFFFQGICWLVFFFFQFDQVNSKYRLSHLSLTNSRPSLGINCLWYWTRRDRRRGGYDSAESYQTRSIFLILPRKSICNLVIFFPNIPRRPQCTICSLSDYRTFPLLPYNNDLLPSHR